MSRPASLSIHSHRYKPETEVVSAYLIVEEAKRKTLSPKEIVVLTYPIVSDN